MNKFINKFNNNYALYKSNNPLFLTISTLLHQHRQNNRAAVIENKKIKTHTYKQMPLLLPALPRDRQSDRWKVRWSSTTRRRLGDI